MKNFKILTEKENPLFKRREITTNIEAEITPSRADTERLISEEFSTQPENIKIKKISGKFGSKTHPGYPSNQPAASGYIR